MPAVTASPLEVVLGIVLFWIGIGLLGVLTPGRTRFVCRVLYPLGAMGGVMLAAVGVTAIGVPWSVLTLPLGLPDLPFHVRLDALSCFFLVLVGGVSAAISCYSA